MKAVFAYKILVEDNLILEYYRGKYNVEELIAFKKQVAKDKGYNPNFNVIHDFRELEFLLGPRDVAKYIKLLQSNPNFVGTRKSCMITATPNQVVASTAFDLLKEKLPISVKICSKLETALLFIDSPTLNFGSINEHFSMLRKK
jgi:hypothetical protein